MKLFNYTIECQVWDSVTGERSTEKVEFRSVREYLIEANPEDYVRYASHALDLSHELTEFAEVMNYFRVGDSKFSVITRIRSTDTWCHLVINSNPEIRVISDPNVEGIC